MSDWWLLIRILNLLLFYSPLNFSRCVFDALKNGYDIKVCACGMGWKRIASTYCSLLRLNRKRNWLKDKLTYDRALHGPPEVRALPAHAHVICNLWSMDRLGISITRKYKFIFMAKVCLPACLFAWSVKANSKRRRRSKKFCGIFQRKNLIRK